MRLRLALAAAALLPGWVVLGPAAARADAVIGKADAQRVNKAVTDLFGRYDPERLCWPVAATAGVPAACLGLVQAFGVQAARGIEMHVLLGGGGVSEMVTLVRDAYNASWSVIARSAPIANGTGPAPADPKGFRFEKLGPDQWGWVGRSAANQTPVTYTATGSVISANAPAADSPALRPVPAAAVGPQPGVASAAAPIATPGAANGGTLPAPAVVAPVPAVPVAATPVPAAATPIPTAPASATPASAAASATGGEAWHYDEASKSYVPASRLPAQAMGVAPQAAPVPASLPVTPAAKPVRLRHHARHRPVEPDDRSHLIRSVPAGADTDQASRPVRAAGAAAVQPGSRRSPPPTHLAASHAAASQAAENRATDNRAAADPSARPAASKPNRLASQGATDKPRRAARTDASQPKGEASYSARPAQQPVP